jgi:hypothetical protein
VVRCIVGDLDILGDRVSARNSGDAGVERGVVYTLAAAAGVG